jgi:pilus assembly protein CpaE
MEHIDALADVCDPGSKVIIIGAVNDISLYRELMDRGISEYIVQPVSPADVVRLISGLYANPTQRLVGRVIAVTGAKGGVGVSTLAQNLAASMARHLQAHTILVDMDIPFGTAGLNFNQEPVTSLVDAMEGGERVDVNFVEHLLTSCEENLSLVASPALVEAAHDVEANVFDAAIDALRAIAPFIILDLPHGWFDWKKHVLLSAEEVLLVVEPDLANLRNGKNLLDYLVGQRPNDLHPKLILNRSGLAKRPEISLADFSKAMGVKPTIVVGHDARLFGTAANHGQLVIDQEGGSKLAEPLRQLSFTLAGRADTQVSHFALFAPWLGRLRNAFG